MKRACGPPNKAQKRYQEALCDLGCACCHYRILQGMQGHQAGATHVHHRNLNDHHGQKQLGQDFVVGMCEWHHEGICLPGYTIEQMTKAFGPSFMRQPKEFRAWTTDAIGGRGTEAWQTYQDGLLTLNQYSYDR